MNVRRMMAGGLLGSLLAWSAVGAAAGGIAIQEYQGVKYVTGGVGGDERDFLKSVQGQFNLNLMFAAGGGAFLSSVKVVIQDARGGTVLDAVADGPLFYAALPPGSYTVTATADQKSQQRKVSIAAGRTAKADFRW